MSTIYEYRYLLSIFLFRAFQGPSQRALRGIVNSSYLILQIIFVSCLIAWLISLVLSRHNVINGLSPYRAKLFSFKPSNPHSSSHMKFKYESLHDRASESFRYDEQFNRDQQSKPEAMSDSGFIVKDPEN